jgi:hypothetical protein
MASTLNAIADALAASLNTVTWAITPITIERKNWIQTDLEHMQDPVVYVTPGGTEDERIGRRAWQIDHTVNVFVGRHVTSDADVTGMLNLSDAIKVAIRQHTYTNVSAWPAGVTSPQTVTIEINPDDALNDRNAWRAVITATYRTVTNDA